RELERYRDRRRRSSKVLAVVTALVFAGGSVGTLAVIRALNRPTSAGRPAAQSPIPSPRISQVPATPPTGAISQRMLQGRRAQRLGPFWFGLSDDQGCVRVT